MSNPFSTLLSRREAAAYLGVHTGTLDNWHQAGSGPPRYKVGGRVVYRQDEIDAWVARGLQRGGMER